MENSQFRPRWKELDGIRRRWNGPWCVGGDWNVVRFPGEKLGGYRTSSDMQAFSDWINTNSLIDLQLNGATFTWSSHQSPPSMSKIDRFLMSTNWLELYSDVCQMPLPKPTSDHCPIMLDSGCERSGPTPFRFEMMWLDEQQFLALIEDWWK